MKALFKRNGIVSMVQVYNIYATDEPFIVHLITKYGRYTCQDIPKEVYICTVREGYSSYGDVDCSQYEFEPEELDYEHVAESVDYTADDDIDHGEYYIADNVGPSNTSAKVLCSILILIAIMIAVICMWWHTTTSEKKNVRFKPRITTCTVECME